MLDSRLRRSIRTPIAPMSVLFSPLKLRSITFPHRVFVSPMCQYSSEDGMPNDWHLVHLGSRAIGGAAMVCVEASGVAPVGRITPWDAGIWSEAHAKAWKPIVERKDAPAEVWQYSGADCVVDFYLYDSDPAGTDGRMEVAYVEARDLRAESAASERCVKSLLQSAEGARL